MKTLIMNDKLIVAEFLSVISFCVLIVYSIQNPFFRLDDRDSIFWIALFTIFAFLQMSAIIFNKDMKFLRICMAWISGSIWTWLTYVNKESCVIIPMIMIGLANFLSFINLCDKVSVDWHSLINE